MSDILVAIDCGNLAVLVLLDLSAAFDMVNHDILLCRLQTRFGIDDVALNWFRSYLVNRMQYIRRGPAQSLNVYLTCCVTQGSVLGPIIFIVYTADLASLVERYELSPHLYADDTQVYGSCSPCYVDSFQTRVSQCTCAVVEWMQSNRLQQDGLRVAHHQPQPTSAATTGETIGWVIHPWDTVQTGSLHRCR